MFYIANTSLSPSFKAVIFLDGNFPDFFDKNDLSKVNT